MAKGTWKDIKTFFGIPKQKLSYTDAEGNEKSIGKFGESTQEEFDEVLFSLPDLIAKSRQGDERAGRTVNELLWHLANEGFNTRTSVRGSFREIFPFGKPEADIHGRIA